MGSVRVPGLCGGVDKARSVQEVKGAVTGVGTFKALVRA